MQDITKFDYDIELLNDVIKYNQEKFNAFIHELPFEINKDYERILNARYQKAYRIRQRLVYLLTRYKYVWFCTFTFDNKYINKCDRTKRDLIKSVLNTHDFIYILNIDYGKTTEREHYHCIIGTNIDFDVNQYIQTYYPCYSLSIQCKKGSQDMKRLSKYINKLVNHCIKATTKRQRLVYNFKGYDLFCENSTTKRIFYKLDVSLLDKADVTGKNYSSDNI